MRGSASNSKVIFAAILLLALAARLMGIYSRPIWYDEAFAILFSEKGPAAILEGTLSVTANAAADIHPPAYYFTLWVWMKAFGETLPVVRLLSILASIGIIILAYLLIKECLNVRAARIAAILLSIAPFHVHYSQEIRMYAFLALWLTAAVFAYWRGSTTHRLRWWLLFAIFAALAQYTHNLAAFFLVPLALTPVWLRDWKTCRAVIISGLGALLLYAMWLIHIPAQFSKIQQSYWTERPGVDRLFALLLSYVTNLPLPDGWLLPGLFIAAFITAIAAWQTVRALRASQENAFRGQWLAYLAFAPAALLFLFSQWQPVYIVRALLPSGIFFWTWVAWVLSETRLPKAMLVLTVFAILSGAGIGIYQHLTYQNFPYAPYRIINEHIRERFTPGDVIIHSNKLTMLPALYYSPDLPQTFIADPPGSGTDTLDQATQRALGISAAPDIQSASGKAGRIWLIIFARGIDEYQHEGYATHPHLAWLDQNYHLENICIFNDIHLHLYSRP